MGLDPLGTVWLLASPMACRRSHVQFAYLSPYFVLFWGCFFFWAKEDWLVAFLILWFPYGSWQDMLSQYHIGECGIYFPGPPDCVCFRDPCWLSFPVLVPQGNSSARSFSSYPPQPHNISESTEGDRFLLQGIHGTNPRGCYNSILSLVSFSWCTTPSLLLGH